MSRWERETRRLVYQLYELTDEISIDLVTLAALQSRRKAFPLHLDDAGKLFSRERDT